MRAAVYHAAGDVRLERRALPQPGEGETLIRVLRSGMCGTDASEWRHGPTLFPVDRPHPASGHLGPLVLGHEFLGEVRSSAGGFRPGDVVASGAGISCGACDRCREGRTNLCRRYVTLGLNRDGGMAEYVAVPESTLVPVPAGLGLDAAGLAQPLAVGLHAVRRSRARDGDRVVIIGAGAIGTFVLAGLRALHDTHTTVVDLAGSRLDRALRLGADAVRAVGEGLGDLGRADVVIEASGAPGQLGTAIGLARPGGTVLQVGLPGTPQDVDVQRLVLNEISIETTLAHVCADDLPAALQFLAATDLAAELLEGVYPLQRLPELLEDLASGRIAGKVLIDPTLDADPGGIS